MEKNNVDIDKILNDYCHPVEKKVKDAKYDVGIVGWWPNANYGSVITYYGLRQTLIELGYSVLMIDAPNAKYNLKYCDLPILGRDFGKRQGYHISKVYNNYNIVMLNDHCETFMIGSDQMWGIWAKDIIGPRYYLNFAFDNKRKIAVGESFGNENYFDKNILAKNAFFVKRFDAISVREDYAVKMAKHYYDVDAKHILDPLFLCDRRSYYYLAQSSGVKKTENYILGYILDPSEEKVQILKYMAEAKNMTVKVIFDANKKDNKEFKKIMSDFKIIDANEEEWLSYILNSDLVVTDSFHGTCMSIIFKRNFVSILNHRRGKDRFCCILNKFGLQDRILDNISELEGKNNKLLEPIDYTKPYEILETLKKDGLEWLKNSLKIEKEKGLTDTDILKINNYELYKKTTMLENKVAMLEAHVNKINTKHSAFKKIANKLKRKK